MFAKLITAIREENINAVQTIIKENPGLLGSSDSRHRTLLHWAATYGKLEISQFLAKQTSYLLGKKDINKRVPLHYAAANGQLKVVKFLVDKKPNTAFYSDNWDETPLDHAIKENHLGTVKFLVKECMHLHNDQNIYSSILYAIEKGNLDIIKFCLTKRPNLIYKLGRTITLNYNENLLHFAVKQGQLSIVNFLCKQNQVADTSIIKLLKLLILRNQPLLEVKLGGDTSELFKIASKPYTGPLKILSFLLDKNLIDQMNPDFQDLFSSVKNDYEENEFEEMVNFFKHLSHPGSRHQFFSNEQFYHVSKKGYLEILKYLLRLNLHCQYDCHDKTPLDYAIENENLPIVEFLCEQDPFLVKKTMLYKAVEKGQVELLKILRTQYIISLKEGSEFYYTVYNNLMDYIDVLDREFLEKATYYKQLNIIKLLIQENPNSMNVSNKNGKNLLHYAIGHGDLKIVNFLIKAGADIHKRDNMNFTPFSTARAFSWLAKSTDEEKMLNYLLLASLDTPPIIELKNGVHSSKEIWKNNFVSQIKNINLNYFPTLNQEKQNIKKTTDPIDSLTLEEKKLVKRHFNPNAFWREPYRQNQLENLILVENKKNI